MMTSSIGNIFRVTGPFRWGNPPVTGWFSSQRPVTRSFDVFFELRQTNVWTNNRDACDLGRHRANYDVTVIWPVRSQNVYPFCEIEFILSRPRCVNRIADPFAGQSFPHIVAYNLTFNQGLLHETLNKTGSCLWTHVSMSRYDWLEYTGYRERNDCSWHNGHPARISRIHLHDLREVCCIYDMVVSNFQGEQSYSLTLIKSVSGIYIIDKTLKIREIQTMNQ